MRLFDDVTSRIADPMLRRAFELAELGRGATAPNPLVGCVLAQGDEIVGEGFHAHAGAPHAEVVALAQAGPDAAGSTAYVTLEPCNHFGKTPPCSEALISKAVAGVVVGMPDPNPIAVGGATRLREAGLEVEFEPDPEPFRIQNEAWLHRLATGDPFVQVKVALSLDGHAHAEDGVRCSVTGEGGAGITMSLRASADAVVVGATTAAIDDPALTVRDLCDRPAERQPVRVVLGRTSVPAATLFSDELGRSVALAHLTTHTPDGVEVVAFDPDAGLRGAFRALADALQIDRVLVEAGPTLLTALLRERAAEEYVFVHAGGMLGPTAPPLYTASDGGAPAQLDCVLRPVESGIVGHEAVTVWRPLTAETASETRGERDEPCSQDS